MSCFQACEIYWNFRTLLYGITGNASAKVTSQTLGLNKVRLFMRVSAYFRGQHVLLSIMNIWWALCFSSCYFITTEFVETNLLELFSFWNFSGYETGAKKSSVLCINWRKHYLIWNLVKFIIYWISVIKAHCHIFGIMLSRSKYMYLATTTYINAQAFLFTFAIGSKG